MEQTQMKALYLEKNGEPLQLRRLDIPKPQRDEILIRVESTTINPADAYFIEGIYASQRTVPCVPGFEGSGTVISSGGGQLADSLINKRVAFYAGGQNGCFAQFTTVNAGFALPIEEDVTFNQAAASFINPLTVIGMLEVVQQAKVKAIVQSPAASSLGRMMFRLFKQNEIDVINIVRRPEQIEILKSEGADIILNQNSEDFLQQLQKITTEKNATIFFDAVGGSLSGKILSVMPNGSKAYIYGGLCPEEISISAIQFVFRDQSIQGFWLNKWLSTKSQEEARASMEKLKKLIKTELKTEIAQECGLEQGSQAINHYLKNMSNGKILFKPWL